MTMAPTRAASSSTETTSNGIRYWQKIESLTVAVLLPLTAVIWRSAGSWSSPKSSSSDVAQHARAARAP